MDFEVAVPAKIADLQGKAGPSLENSHPFRLAIVLSHPVQYFSPLFRRLAQQAEIEITVLYSTLAGVLPARDPDFGVSVSWDVPLLDGYKHKTLKNYWPGTPRKSWTYICPGVIKDIRHNKYDAVLVYGWGDLTAWMALASARVRGVPCLITGDTVSFYDRDNSTLKAFLKKVVLKLLFRNIQAFLVTGRFNRAFYEDYGVPANKFFFVPLAVDNDYFARRAESARARKSELRARYGIPADMVLLLFSGKLISRKRPLDVLHALRSLQADFPNLGAVWVGDGELRPHLEDEIARNGVRHAYTLGFRNQSELPDLYAMSDIFVLPSMRDPMPLVTNEAMASGLPVVASDRTGVWGPSGLVRDGETGFVYPGGDAAALASAIRKLLVDGQLRDSMARRASEVVREFGFDQCVRGILGALKSVAHRKTDPSLPL